LGGAVVAAPFLSSLSPRSVKAKSGGVTAKRLIVMFTHYGCITNRWFPEKLDGELTAADLMPTSLSPLAPFAEKLLLPRGIRGMNEWTPNNQGPGLGRGQGNDMHTQEVASALTCQPVSPNSNDPFAFENAKRDAMPIGPSLDHVIAQQLSPNRVPLLLNTASQRKEAAWTAVSYAAAQQIFEASDASTAFASLTGLLGSGAVNGDSWELSKGKLLADVIKADLDTLRRHDMSKADQHKLDAWLELANDVSRTMAARQCSRAVGERLGADRQLAAGGDGDAVTRKISDTMDNADLYAAIATLTAACDANPVIVLKHPGAFVFQGLGIYSDSDLLAHRVGQASLTGTCAKDVVAQVLKIDAYQAQKFANLVRMLDSIIEDDDGRTLLDSSVAVWTTDCSDGFARNLNNLPILQAGSGNDYFKTGKIINLDAASGATPAQMLGRSLAACVDDPSAMVNGLDQATGTDPAIANRPVNKYFCNLMNALGVRADAAGYPSKDGAAGEVTHFGYADRTEDFCGGEGAVADAGIHDPGAFTELNA
jgi:hypothetical protein